MRAFISCLALLLVLCSTTPPRYEYKTLKLMSDEGGFQIEAPANWTYIKLKGIDSFIGAIATGKSDTLYFNMGRYAPSLDHPFYRDRKDEEENEDKFKFKETWQRINEYHVKFASHWMNNRSDYGIYFDSLWTIDHSGDFQNKMKLTFYGHDLLGKTKKQLNAAVQTIIFFKH